MSWNPPRKYKGLRSQYEQAASVKIPYPERNRMYRDNLNEKLSDMEEWCERYCTREWYSSCYSHWSFAKTTEAVLFKMIFGGK